MRAETSGGAQPHPHDGKGLYRGQNMIVTGAGMVGMAVRYHGAGNRTMRIDMKAAGPAKKSVTIDRKPRSELSRFHIFGCLCRTKHVFEGDGELPKIAREHPSSKKHSRARCGDGCCHVGLSEKRLCQALPRGRSKGACAFQYIGLPPAFA